jgi:hypothetical protein
MSIPEGLRQKRLLSASGEQKQETAKEILDRHLLTGTGEGSKTLAAMKEIADKAWEACSKRIYQEDYSGDDPTAPDKSTFMKELFPEDIKDTSASG